MTVGNLTYTNEPVIGNIIAGSSAEQAHLEANDRIITIDGKKISTWDDIRPSLTRHSKPWCNCCCRA